MSSTRRSLAERRNKECVSCRKQCLCRKPSNHSQHRSPFSRLRLNVQNDPRSRLPRGKDARPFLRPASSKKVCSRSTSTLGAKLLNLSRFRSQVAPIVTEASCDKTGRATKECSIHRFRNPLDVKRVLREASTFAHSTQEDRLGLIPKFLVWRNFKCRSHTFSAVSCKNPDWMSSCTCLRSCGMPQFKNLTISPISNSQISIEVVQVSILDQGFNFVIPLTKLLASSIVVPRNSSRPLGLSIRHKSV